MMWAIVNYSIILVTLVVLLAVWAIYMVVGQVHYVANHWQQRISWSFVRTHCCQTDAKKPTNSTELERLNHPHNSNVPGISSVRNSSNNSIHLADGRPGERSIAKAQVHKESRDTGSMGQSEGNDKNGARLLDMEPPYVSDGSIGQSHSNEETDSTLGSTDIENSATDESQGNGETLLKVKPSDADNTSVSESKDDTTATTQSNPNINRRTTHGTESKVDSLPLQQGTGARLESKGTESPIVTQSGDASNNTGPDGTHADADNSYTAETDSFLPKPIECTDGSLQRSLNQP